MSKIGISVVVPNYNGVELLPKILPALMKALAYTGLPNEIIVSDDCSPDGSISLLKQHFPAVKIIENSQNKGFSPTINKGIFSAQYDYVLLLNSDVLLSEDYFIPLLRYFDKEDTFGVMGRIVGWDDDLIQDAAKYPSFHGAKIKTTGNYYLPEPQKNDWLFSMYLSGANAFVDRKKLLLLNGFNELYAPFYVEDFDLSLRAWRIGWKCYYEHFAVCRHKVSVSIKSKNKKAFINSIYYRNKMYLHAIHLTGLPLMLWYLQLFPETLIRLFTGRLYFLKALKMFFSNGKGITISQHEFKLQCQQSKNILSVKEVVKTILDSLKDKTVQRF